MDDTDNNKQSQNDNNSSGSTFWPAELIK